MLLFQHRIGKDVLHTLRSELFQHLFDSGLGIQTVIPIVGADGLLNGFFAGKTDLLGGAVLCHLPMLGRIGGGVGIDRGGSLFFFGPVHFIGPFLNAFPYHIHIDQNILSGAIIVQSSKGGESWITDVTMMDVFTGNDDLSDALYITKDIQLENGCYYRVIVAYELQRKVGEGKILFVTTEEKEEKKVAEVYEFYAVSSEADGNTTSAAATPRKELGQKVNTGKDNGYSGNSAIDKDDPHYGWNLGTFVVNGYTRETSSNGVPVFLKNAGDKVTLWFTLTQDINNLNGNSALTISEDTNGYDQYFEIAQTNFERGTLIIQYTDYEGNAHAPVIYTDFLAANAATGADASTAFPNPSYT